MAAAASGTQEVVELAKLSSCRRAVLYARDRQRFAGPGTGAIKLAGGGARDREAGLVQHAVASFHRARQVA
jgi:hypothetical protein